MDELVCCDFYAFEGGGSRLLIFSANLKFRADLTTSFSIFAFRDASSKASCDFLCELRFTPLCRASKPSPILPRLGYFPCLGTGSCQPLRPNFPLYMTRNVSPVSVPFTIAHLFQHHPLLLLPVLAHPRVDSLCALSISVHPQTWRRVSFLYGLSLKTLQRLQVRPRTAA